MAPYAVSGGRVKRPRDTRPTDQQSRRRRSTHGSRDPSRHKKSSDSPDKSTDSSLRDPQTSRKQKYEPLRPTIRAVPPEGRRKSTRVVRDADSAAAAAALDGGGDTPDSRLMGGERLVKDMTRKKSKSAAATAAGDATAASHRHHWSHMSRSGNGNRDEDRSKGKRPYPTDSDELESPPNKRRCGKCFWILGAITLLLMIILIPVGVLVVGKEKKSTVAASSGQGKYGEQSKLPEQSTIPSEYKNTYLDPYTWLDTKDFNLTFTSKMVGGLSVMGLFDEYDDSVQANSNVPPLNQGFDYGKTPIRGVNVGGWLIIEPFITPSYFKAFDSKLGVVDEYTMSAELGPISAKVTIEKHYKEFVTEDTFKEIRDAGLDHVRIPFGYWAVKTYDNDSYVPNVSWRYLLRAIEWARKYGLRVKLDLHSVPGGANGWNHSGRLGPIGWLNGPNGDENGKSSLEIHAQLAEFFSQPRYQNIITMYGLVNEPRMTELKVDRVLKWTSDAYTVVRDKGYKGKIIFGDGFRGLSTWKGAFSGLDGMLLDVHQYVIFNTQQISLTHSGKIEFACNTWGPQMIASMDKTTGFGPTIVGEWGQADTDCTEYLNNVGVGSRWEGTMNATPANGQVLTPCCPGGKDCSCKMPNGDPKDYTAEYRRFLKMFAEAQMHAFEEGWGWLYWTWDTESSTQWSYKKSLVAGIIPDKAYSREFNCELDKIPDFKALGLTEGN